jgi:hypothetical protein
MDIVITRDNFQTLMDVVIADLTCPYLVFHVLTTTVHASIFAAQNKTQSYTKQTLGNDFIPLVIKTYSCLHLHFDFFFTSCLMLI